MNHRLVVFVLAGGLACMVKPSLALAQVAPVPSVTAAPTAMAPPQPQGKATLAVQFIHATTGSGTGITKALARRLGVAFPNYKKFTSAGDATLVLEQGASGQAKLPNGADLKLTFLGVAGSFLKLRLEIPPKLKTDLRVKDGGTFYQAGIKYKAGILILAIKAAGPSKAE